MSNETKRIIVIDANSVIHRAYHALPRLTTKNGELVNAVYGFLLVFLKAVKDFQPDFIAACFDARGPTFRHKKYKGYKAKRPPAPEDLYQQIPRVKEFLEGFSVSVFEKEGFEADDIIGTIATLAPRKPSTRAELGAGLVVPAIETIILSGDLDTLQLVNPQTKVFALRKGVKDIVLYDEKLVEEKFQGIKPQQLLDYKALRGDPSDNIPGVTGVGEKTAIGLLLKFKNLENLYEEIEENSAKAKNLSPKLKETLLKYKEQAFLSKQLAEIEKNTPIDFNLTKCRWGQYDKEKVIGLLKKFEFYSLITRVVAKGEEEDLSSSPNRLSENKDIRQEIERKTIRKKKDCVGENLRLW